jgi:putative N6-adenine-specific DNA methylase
MNKNKSFVFFSRFCCVNLIRTHQERMAKSLFVTCARGLEPILANELASLGYKKRTQEFRGNLLYFSNTEETLNAVYRYVTKNIILDFFEFFGINYSIFFRLNYLSRVAMRVLYPLKKFHVSNKDDLYHQVKKINWSDYLRVDQTFAIRKFTKLFTSLILT